MNNIVLEIKNLSISFFEHNIENIVINNFSYSFKKNITTAIVGPSGSGKSLISLACLNLLPESSKIKVSGNIFLENKNCILQFNSKDNYLYRGVYSSIIFQNPFTSLNPVYTCGYQLSECLKKSKENFDKKYIYNECLKFLKQVELDDVEKIYNSYPHELSGGQLQRVLISFALALKTKVIFADEITTALDPYTKNKILNLLKNICDFNNITLIIISHDINIVKNYSDEILILNKGKIIERGNTKNLLKKPKKNFTKSLILCKPKIINNPFFLPFLKNNKIIYDGKILKKEAFSNSIIELKNLSLFYNNFKALNNINLKLKENDIIGIIGRSGSGKSSLSNIISLVNKNYQGSFFYKGKNIRNLNKKNINKKIQLVFQNPESSLNPKQKINACLREVLYCNNIINNKDSKILFYLNQLELNKNILNKYPHELSGGQKQRVCIVRILLTDPEIIIFDESVSALDMNTQAHVLNLIKKIYYKNTISIIYISHDISTVSFLCNKIYVLNKGTIIDSFIKENILSDKRHKETLKLINNN